MAAPGRPQAETDRRDQLLKAARNVFAEKGYDRATVGDIVRAAGVAQGTFYLYFPSKKAILVTLAQEFRNKLLGALFDPKLDALSLADRTRAMVRGAFRVSRDNPDLVKALHMGVDVAAVDASDMDLGGEGLVDVEGRVTDFIRERVGPEALKPMTPEIVTKMVSSMVERASLECFVFGDGSQADRYEDTLVEMIERVLLDRK